MVSCIRALAAGTALACLVSAPALADCSKLPNHAALTNALKASVKPSGGPSNGGLDNHMWAVLVDRDGVVCAVTFSGSERGDQWPGSRGIAASKATTANGVSSKTQAMSTANLYAGAQPGGFLYGIETLNPVDPTTAYSGNPNDFGTENDPMVGQVVGGTVVFGGGLALYDATGILGALGVSGDTSCADHNVAWRVRAAIGLDKVPGGPSPHKNDEIVYDIPKTAPTPKSVTGYGHPLCGGEADVAVQIGAGSIWQP